MREVKGDRPKLPGMNLLDRAISYVSPKTAARRLLARQAMALTGGYKGGSGLRPATRNFNPLAGAPEVDINLDLPDLRPRSRHLARNAPPATAAINVNVTSVVGTGLAMQPRIHRDVLKMDEEAAKAWEVDTRRKFELWANSTFCDAEQTNNFYEMQGVVLRSQLESGDVFALTPQIQRPNWPFKLSLHLLEADRVCNPNFAPDSEKIIGGIEVGKYGEPIACHITNVHPCALRRSGIKWSPVKYTGENTGRRNVLHVFEQLRPGQKRGVPYLAPVIEQLRQLEDYTDAELRAAVVTAAFAIFIKMDHEAFTDLFDKDAQETIVKNSTSWNGDIDTGKAINLLPGEEPFSVSPGRPNSEFDPFVTAIFRQIGMALEIPYEVLVMHFQSSYSAARAALMTAWRLFRKRREFLASNFCQPVYELWLAEAVSSGQVRAPGFFSSPLVRAAWCNAKWTGDAPGAINPEVEAKAAKMRLEIGTSTLDAECMLHDGEDWESKHAQQVKERQARVRDGLISPEVPAAIAPAVEPDADDAAEADEQDVVDQEDKQEQGGGGDE